ncbi:MAG: hypothetical protein HZC02_01215 [Candidatus Levybacteria bacterium]|nr:hypothetical protein [Candidatus Levybacteria bacterium]
MKFKLELRQRENQRFQEFVVPNEPLTQNSPEMKALMQGSDLLLLKIAARIKEDDRSIPLMDDRDIDILLVTLANAIAKEDDLSREERDQIKAIMQKMVSAFVTSILESLGPETDPYESFWLYVNHVYEVTKEYACQLQELLTNQDALDELTRRQYSREKLEEDFQKVLESMFNMDMLKRAFLDPLLDIIAESPEDRAEIEEEFQNEDLSDLIRKLEVKKSQVRDFFTQEINRIYGLTSPSLPT